MDDAVKDFVRAHARETPELEVCGMVWRQPGEKKPRIARLRNVARNPRDEFRVDGVEALSILGESGEVELYYHSHPRTPAAASPADIASAEAEGTPMLIYAVGADAFSLYEPNGHRLPYEGRPWVYGILDCWALAHDWYAWEKGVVLPDFPRADDWWERGKAAENWFGRHVPEHFDPVELAAAAHGDLLLFALNPRGTNRDGVANHCAVYLGDGLMLHHAANRLSGLLPFVADRGFWADALYRRCAWRLKDN